MAKYHSRADRHGHEGAISTEYLFLMVVIALAIALGATAFGLALGGAFDDSGERVASEVNTISG